MTANEYAKSLRSSIVVAIKKNYQGHDYRDLLHDWGYQCRLSKITDIDLLIEIKNVANGQPVMNANIGHLDAQGKYLIVLMKKAGWDIKRLRALLIKTTGCAHWSRLTQAQQRQIIKIVKSYQEKNTTEGNYGTNQEN